MSRDVVLDESASWYEPEPSPPEPSTNDLDNTEEGSNKVNTQGQSDLNQIERTTRATKRSKHISAESRDRQRKDKNVGV